MTVSDDLNELKRQTEREVDILRQHLVAKLNMSLTHIENTVELYRRERETAEVHHSGLHTLEQQNLEEFKTYVREQINIILRALETARADRANFVTRDTHDTALDVLEKAVISLEKNMAEKHDAALAQLIEKHDAALKQANDGLSTKINANSERITKMEQGIQVMNARNQQSIIALGALLTAVEILIRFFTN